METERMRAAVLEKLKARYTGEVSHTRRTAWEEALEEVAALASSDGPPRKPQLSDWAKREIADGVAPGTYAPDDSNDCTGDQDCKHTCPTPAPTFEEPLTFDTWWNWFKGGFGETGLREEDIARSAWNQGKVVARAAAAPPPTASFRTRVADELELQEFGSHCATKVQKLLTNKYTNSQMLVGGIIAQELRIWFDALLSEAEPQPRAENPTKRFLEVHKRHQPRNSDLVGWFTRCSCGFDAETEEEWQNHIADAWKAAGAEKLAGEQKQIEKGLK